VRRAVLLALAAAACSHGEPYAFGVDPLAGTHEPFGWEQLTFNAGDDLDPAWYPDGSSFIYATERLDRADHDRCLAVMPAAGGTIRSMTCERKPSSADTIDVFAVPSPGPDGRVAFLYTTFDLFRFTNYYTRWLVVGTLDSPLVRRNRIIPYPYKPGGGYTHDGVGEIRWLSPTRLAYQATLPAYPLCKTCRPDAATPVQIILADIGGDTAVTQAVGNAIYTTSLTSVGEDTLYFTLLGDGRIFRRVLSTGEETLVHDFGIGVIARDVQVHASRVVAIVGGLVDVEFLPGQGYVQNDDGGVIHILDLDTGVETVMGTGGRLFRRDAISPDGRELLAESRDLARGDWDIWRIQLP
jgi:WD40 repeat protein